jgi:hypothetical protein
MAYKARFRPSEVLISGTWRTLTEADLDIPEDVSGTSVSEPALITEPTV